MRTSLSAHGKMTRDLRHAVASVISDFKAYDVPILCARLGLREGTSEEAYSSKFKYAEKRLTEVDTPEILDIGRKLLQDCENYELSEVVAKFEEMNGNEVTELTRRRILSVFDELPICTEISEIELLGRVWPIADMPSVTFSLETTSFAGDFIRHRIESQDWNSRDALVHLGILTCSRHRFFKFLVEVTSPLAQAAGAQRSLATKLNEYLMHDGYALASDGKISGSLRYDVKIRPRGSPSDMGISEKLQDFDPEHLHARWQAALDRRDTDPPGAITLSRTLLEDVCKWILTEAEQDFDEGSDLPSLYRQMSKILMLAPDDHTEEIFKQILSGCRSVVTGLGTLRNKLSDAHGTSPTRARALPRHAELAVNLSGAMATFLVSTWVARQREKRAVL